MKTRLIPLFLGLLALGSCQRNDTNLVSEPGNSEILVCSLTGDVQGRSRKNRDWESLSCGILLKEGQEFRTGESEAFLRTGKGLILKLGPHSEMSFAYSSREEKTTVTLSRGALAVENPGTDLTVQLPHQSLYAGEGTFSLLIGDERVEVYNHEGELRLLPGIGDLSRLKRITREEDHPLIDALPENQRPLFPGETWYLDGEDLRSHSKLYDQLLLENDGLEREWIDLEQPVQDILNMAITISEYTRFNYDSLLKGFDLFRPDGDHPFYRLAIQSDEGALIKTDFTRGKERINLILAENRTLPVHISRPGYQSLDAAVGAAPVSAFTDNRYYKLPRLTSRKIAIKVDPAESEITINGIYAGKGSIVLDVKPDEPLEVNFTLDGYNEQYLYLDAEKEWPETIDLTLKKTVEKVLKGAYQEIIGLAAQGPDIFIADWSGIIWYLNEPSGWRRYNTRTSNYPNSYSEPVLTDNYIYFSGKRNLVVINRLSGAILNTIRLNDRENHLNGQKGVPMDYQFLYPTKDSLRFLTGDGQKIREVFIPGGSLMTPALYGGNIYTAAMDGQIYEISTTGKILRSLATGLESPMGQAIVFDRGRGYLCDSFGRVAAFSPSSMTMEWVSDPLNEKRNFIRNVQLTEERVYTYDGSVLSVLDRNTGKALPPLSKTVQTYPLLEEPFIYAMTGDQSMTVFSSETGKAIREIDLGYEVTSPIYSFDGRIMAGTFDGNVLIMNHLDPSLLSKPTK
ncbi:MAG: PQQ-like beta-propeller repeat protein [Spirochaetales bacterium]|nr:PQQ-like beta-propeller repeat protein [Spirochaetales bacterium]